MKYMGKNEDFFDQTMLVLDELLICYKFMFYNKHIILFFKNYKTWNRLKEHLLTNDIVYYFKKVLEREQFNEINKILVSNQQLKAHLQQQYNFILQ